jgi:hypothetical protein
MPAASSLWGPVSSFLAHMLPSTFAFRSASVSALHCSALTRRLDCRGRQGGPTPRLSLRAAGERNVNRR